MMKLVVVVVCIAFLGTVFADDASNAESIDTSAKIEAKANDIAKWLTAKLNTDKEEYFVQKVYDAKADLLDKKIKFSFAVDLAINENNGYSYKSCDVVAIEEPWTNSRYLEGTPLCSDVTF